MQSGGLEPQMRYGAVFTLASSTAGSTLHTTKLERVGNLAQAANAHSPQPCLTFQSDWRRLLLHNGTQMGGMPGGNCEAAHQWHSRNARAKLASPSCSSHPMDGSHLGGTGEITHVRLHRRHTTRLFRQCQQEGTDKQAVHHGGSLEGERGSISWHQCQGKKGAPMMFEARPTNTKLTLK